MGDIMKAGDFVRHKYRDELRGVVEMVGPDGQFARVHFVHLDCDSTTRYNNTEGAWYKVKDLTVVNGLDRVLDDIKV